MTTEKIACVLPGCDPSRSGRGWPTTDLAEGAAYA